MRATRMHNSLAIRHCARDSRGVSTVEAALVLPVFFLVFFAIIQMSVLVMAYLDARHSSASGARDGAIAANSPTADYDVLRAIQNNASLVPHKNIVRVVVYKAQTAQADVPPSCLSGPVTDVCNVYTAADFGQPESAFEAGGIARAQAWPSASRKSSRLAGSDLIGVYVEIKSQDIGGMMPMQETFKQRSVTRLETLSS